MSTPGVTANPANQMYFTQLNSLEPATEYLYRIESRNRFSSLFADVESFITRDGSEFKL